MGGGVLGHTHRVEVDSGGDNMGVDTCVDEADTWDKAVAFRVLEVAFHVLGEVDTCDVVVVLLRSQVVVEDTSHHLGLVVEEDRVDSNHQGAWLLVVVGSQVVRVGVLVDHPAKENLGVAANDHHGALVAVHLLLAVHGEDVVDGGVVIHEDEVDMVGTRVAGHEDEDTVGNLDDHDEESEARVVGVVEHLPPLASHQVEEGLLHRHLLVPLLDLRVLGGPGDPGGPDGPGDPHGLGGPHVLPVPRDLDGLRGFRGPHVPGGLRPEVRVAEAAPLELLRPIFQEEAAAFPRYSSLVNCFSPGAES